MCTNTSLILVLGVFVVQTNCGNLTKDTKNKDYGFSEDVNEINAKITNADGSKSKTKSANDTKDIINNLDDSNIIDYLDYKDLNKYLIEDVTSSTENYLDDIERLKRTVGTEETEWNKTVANDCVGSEEYCNMTREEYITMLNNYIYPQTYEWVLIGTHTVVFVVGLVGNALVCIAVYRNHTMRTVTNYFIVNLAVADFMVILFCLPPTVLWDVTETWFLGNVLCKLLLYFQVRWFLFKSLFIKKRYFACDYQIFKLKNYETYTYNSLFVTFFTTNKACRFMRK